MKLQKRFLIGLLTLILLLSVIIGHFLPPAGILITPIVLSIMVALIIFTDNGFMILEKSALSYLYIGLNDIGIKLFAGGRHDMEGVGWIHGMLFIGLAPCFIMLLIGVFRDEDSAIWLQILSVIMFILLIYVHRIIFEKLGMYVG